jgi:hypothetical protein
MQTQAESLACCSSCDVVGGTPNRRVVCSVMEMRQRAGTYKFSQNEVDVLEQHGGKCGDGHMH